MNKELLTEKIIAARKSRDKVSVQAYQYVLSAVHASEGREPKYLDGDQILKLVEKEIKSLNEMIDLGIDKNDEKTMVEVLSQLLPEKISVDKYPEIVQYAINNVGAVNVKDMGKVMGEIKTLYGSTVDNKVISGLVRENLVGKVGIGSGYGTC